MSQFWAKPHPRHLSKKMTVQQGSKASIETNTKFQGQVVWNYPGKISARMVGLSAKESIKFMESKLTQMGTDDQDTIVMGIIIAHMLVKQATRSLAPI